MSQSTILIVDDAVDTLHLIGTFLRQQGFNVLTATNGESGLAMAREHRPAVVVTDMLMPGPSGFRVIDQLKSEGEFRPKVVMISAQETPLLRAYALALGADEFLIKPFALQELLESVRKLCPAATNPHAECNGTAEAVVRL
jgi:DNA-binding response OmpR family regulator